MAAKIAPGRRNPKHRAVFRIEQSGIAIADGEYRRGGRSRGSDWYEHLDHPGLKIIYAFGRWSFPTDAIRSLLQMYLGVMSTWFHFSFQAKFPPTPLSLPAAMQRQNFPLFSFSVRGNVFCWFFFGFACTTSLFPFLSSFSLGLSVLAARSRALDLVVCA